MEQFTYLGQGHALNFHLLEMDGIPFEIYVNRDNGEWDHVNCFFKDNGDPYHDDQLTADVWANIETIMELITE